MLGTFIVAIFGIIPLLLGLWILWPRTAKYLEFQLENERRILARNLRLLAIDAMCAKMFAVNV